MLRGEGKGREIQLWINRLGTRADVDRGKSKTEVDTRTWPRERERSLRNRGDNDGWQEPTRERKNVVRVTHTRQRREEGESKRVVGAKEEGEKESFGSKGRKRERR